MVSRKRIFQPSTKGGLVIDMRKYCITAFCLMSMLFLIGNTVSAEAVLKFRIEPAGKIDKEYSAIGDSTFTTRIEQDVVSGYSVAGEYLKKTKGDLLFGGGIEYQSRRRVVGDNNYFNFIPLYFLVRTNTLSTKQKTRPFLSGKIGYNLYHESDPGPGYDIRGGLYYGFGAGIMLQKNLQMELAYTNNNSELDSTSLAIKHSYGEIGFSLGYRF
jgi:hypothetical protein